MMRWLFVLMLHGKLLAQVPDTTQVDLVVAHHLVTEDRLFKGIPNPIDVAVPGLRCGEFEVSVARGRISGSGCSYLITPDTTEGTWYLLLEVSWNHDAERKVARHGFWVRELPLPIAYYAGVCSSDTVIELSHVKAGAGVLAKYVDERLRDIGFSYDRPEMGHYQVSILRDGVRVFSGESGTGVLPAEIKEAFQRVQPNDRLEISNIQIIGANGRIQELAPIRVRVR